MKDASRAQAIIEILDEVIKDKIPADVIIDKYEQKVPCLQHFVQLKLLLWKRT